MDVVLTVLGTAACVGCGAMCVGMVGRMALRWRERVSGSRPRSDQRV